MTTTAISRDFADDGVALLRGLVPAQLLRALDELMRARVSRVMDALGTRPIGIGSRNGYHELVQRSPGRFDVPLSDKDLEPIWGARGSAAPEVPWMEWVRAVLGPDAQPSFCGVVFSRPGSPAQQWHIDSPHEAAEHRPAHAINVMLALANIPLVAGPTEVARGSHWKTNHLANPRLNLDDLLYQSATELTPASLGANASLLQAMSAGDCLIFDDRILHRGLANSSAQERWVAYFSYLRPRPGMDRIAGTHFEATKSLFA